MPEFCGLVFSLVEPGGSTRFGLLKAQPDALSLGSHQTGSAGLVPTIGFTAATRSVIPSLLQIPAQAQFVRFHARLPLPLAERYRQVILSANGERLCAQEFPVSTLPAPQRSTIVLPASILSPGLYHFQIEGATASGRFELLEDHVFRVATK